MDLIAVDDSEQRKPERKGMGPLVAVGGIHVPGDQVLSLECRLAELCEEIDCPAHQEFKWSPGRREWFRGVEGEDRTRFFARCLDAAAEAGATALVVIEDKKKRMAIANSSTHEEDAVRLLLERGDNLLRELESESMVLADRPGGRRRDENRFVGRCLDTLRKGTDFVKFERIGLVVTGDSRHSRLVQLADVLTSCARAEVAGGSDHHPALFAEKVKPLLRRDAGGRIGGFGLKIHPDLRYANLYHWLLGDDWVPQVALPTETRPYAESPDDP